MKNENKAKGGLARAKALTPEERQISAQKAAMARWGVKIFRKGNLKEHFGIDVDCYVLDDLQKTAVISKQGMVQAIGFNSKSDQLVKFVTNKTMEKYITRELLHKITEPRIVQRSQSPVSKAEKGNELSEKKSEIHLYDVTILIDLCNAILNARRDEKLKDIRYQKMIEQAEIIVTSSAKLGIKNLVYAVSGYNPSSEEVIQAFKTYVREEARKYEPEFPSELYLQWHRLYNIEIPQKGKPWQFKHLTLKHIYIPLAQSNGKVLDLLRIEKSKDGDQKKKLFQFLNEIGAKALRIHLGRVLEMCDSSPDKCTYEAKIMERFGGPNKLDLITPPNLISNTDLENGEN